MYAEQNGSRGRRGWGQRPWPRRVYNTEMQEAARDREGWGQGDLRPGPVHHYQLCEGNSVEVQGLGLCALTAEAGVRSLIGELKSHKSGGMAKKKKKYSTGCVT